jgi:hypothetical protein
MTPPIERIRYYDGEYLRAFDFAAEQGYHVDMRRRLNMALHLHGIGEGLQLSSTKVAGISQVSISPGMAIDSYGREIFLLAPYAFNDETDVLANRISSTGFYNVWIKYQRVADTPPSAGYAACNGTDQTTRWHETYKIVLLQTFDPTNTPTDAVAVPAVTDDISEEDPDSDTSNGVFLGVVYVEPGSTTGVFSLKGTQPPLTYVGLRAQQIQPPNFPDTVSPAFDVKSSANSLVPPIGVDIPANLFVDQNLIVGANFNLINLPSGYTPPPAGNVKVAGDLFVNTDLLVNGDMYLYAADPAPGQWLGLADFIKGLMPAPLDIQTGSFDVPTDPNISGNLSDGSMTLNLTSTIKSIGSAQIIASISAMQFDQQSKVKTLLDPATHPTAQLNIHVSAALVSKLNNTAKLSITWVVGPKDASSPPNVPLVSLTISWIVIFYPQ